MPHGQPNPLLYVVPLLILAPVLFFRMRRMMGSRPLRLHYLWVRPLIFIGLCAAMLVAAPPPGRDLPWLALAAIIGTGLGWQWGRTMAIHVHPENGTLMATGSQAAMMVFLALLVLRLGLRTGLQMEAAAWHLDAAFLTDIFIVFAAFLFALRSLEMYLRGRRVLAEKGGAA